MRRGDAARCGLSLDDADGWAVGGVALAVLRRLPRFCFSFCLAFFSCDVTCAVVGDFGARLHARRARRTSGDAQMRCANTSDAGASGDVGRVRAAKLRLPAV